MYLFGLFAILLICFPIIAANDTTSWGISFIESLPDGSCSAYFDSNGKVYGHHGSPGNITAVVDTAPKCFLDTLFELAKIVIDSCQQITFNEDNLPYYELCICVGNGHDNQNCYKYSRYICEDFKLMPIRRLCALIGSTSITYSPQSPNWKIKYDVGSNPVNIDPHCDSLYHDPKINKKIKQAADERNYKKLEKLSRELIKK